MFSESTALQMRKNWQIRDESFNGHFVIAVKTTGIFCQPSCPTRPFENNIQFLGSNHEALVEGFRTYKRCSHLEKPGAELTVSLSYLSPYDFQSLLAF